eukprot:CAMPEP_0197079060 /NCGR_PEP_ID=MMETSP1384-20130603/213433_1 /TAXON_ID=29189 /ORGANISM="Ammonia sp." /LENGTH=391 /DNA_ID=CAMNT_0042517931 /DNA_START=356 /DNA_END=1531 /DNA_ORIENTATION=-
MSTEQRDFEVRSVESDNEHKEINIAMSLQDQPHHNGNDHPLISDDDIESNLLGTTHQPIQPYFNNQNSILMAARSCHGDLMLMHETRIFYFRFDSKKTKTDRLYAEATQELMTLLLGMLTTRKYRLLSSFYLLWHILDMGVLFALVSTLFFDGTPHRFVDVITDNILIFLVVALEIFYDVLEFLVKIWFINRVSLYIAFALYILYFLVLFPKWYQGELGSVLVFTLFWIRFAAFICGTFIDYCIDLELEWDLLDTKMHALDVPCCIKTTREEKIGILHIKKDNKIEIPQHKDLKFVGSVCAWTTRNAFKCKVTPKEHPWLGYQCIFHLMFAITYCIFGIPLLIIISIWTLILTGMQIVARRCCCRPRDDENDDEEEDDGHICDECFHRYSY